MRGVLVTGTDTGVGKTVVTATLCRILRQKGVDAVAVKPFATGIGPDTHWRDNDPLLLSAAMDYAEPPEVIAPLRLPIPLSPYDAARICQTPVDIESIHDKVCQLTSRHEFIIVEGVGGVLVPLTDSVTFAGFAKQLGLPALVVARSRLGTINHTLLTTSALNQAGIHVEGVLFTRSTSGELALDEKACPETACRFAHVALLGLVEHVDALASAESIDAAVAALHVNDKTLRAVADELLQRINS